MGAGRQIAPDGTPYYTISGELEALERRSYGDEAALAAEYAAANADAVAAEQAHAEQQNLRAAGVSTAGMGLQQLLPGDAAAQGFDPAAGRTPISVSGEGVAAGPLARLAAGPGAAGGGPVPSPMALAQQVPLSSQRVTRPGNKAPMMALQARRPSLRAEIAAVEAGGRAEAAQAKAEAAIHEAGQFEAAGRQALAERAQAKVQAEVEEHHEQYQELRQAANKEIDSGRWVRSQSLFQKIAYIIASGIQGFVQGYQGKSGNPILDFINQSIDRDIAIQKADLAGKRTMAAEERNAIGMLSAQLGDMRQGEAQYRLVANEQIQARLAEVAARFKSPQVLARIQAGTAALEGDYAAKQAAAKEAGRSRTSTKVQSKSLYDLLMMQAKLRKEMGGKLKEPTDPTRKQAGFINAARKGLILFVSKYKKLNLPGGATAWMGRQAASVSDLRDLVIDEVGKGLDMQGEAYLKKVSKQLGGNWTSDADLLERVRNVGHTLDASEQSLLEAEAPYRYVAPLAATAIKNRKLFNAAVGGGGH